MLKQWSRFDASIFGPSNIRFADIPGIDGRTIWTPSQSSVYQHLEPTLNSFDDLFGEYAVPMLPPTNGQRFYEPPLASPGERLYESELTGLPSMGIDGSSASSFSSSGYEGSSARARERRRARNCEAQKRFRAYQIIYPSAIEF